jgi:hypothetical protein
VRNHVQRENHRLSLPRQALDEKPGAWRPCCGPEGASRAARGLQRPGPFHSSTGQRICVRQVEGSGSRPGSVQ